MKLSTCKTKKKEKEKAKQKKQKKKTKQFVSLITFNEGTE